MLKEAYIRVGVRMTYDLLTERVDYGETQSLHHL